MPPKKDKRTRLEAGEEQYGSIFSVSGPVIVAENMIGCAMYELVSSSKIQGMTMMMMALADTTTHHHSAVSVMTTSSVKLFALRMIKLQFRCTKRQVTLQAKLQDRGRRERLTYDVL